MDFSCFLSEFGKRMYLPNGITVQSGQAKKLAVRHNATAGVAKENGRAMFLPSHREFFSGDISPDEVFLYAPLGGVEALRNQWALELVKKNPSLSGKVFTKPIVTSGITNSLYIVSRLFADKEDTLVLPNLYWENYDLIFKVQNQTDEVTFDFFNDGGFNSDGLDKAIKSVKSEKVVVLLNFPNNPTGYSPTKAEADSILEVLKANAESGKKIVAVFDDAYFGLFFNDSVNKESLFARACDLHENILAVKCDGATKEEMVWGFRTGFITYARKGAEESDFDDLIKKTLGTLRGNVSNCSLVAQNIILKGLQNPEHDREKQVLFDKLKEHYDAIMASVEKHKDCTCLTPMPCNSGYFMSFETKCNADELRLLLLNKYNVGVIAIQPHVLRVTFSSVDAKDMDDLIDCVCQAAQELC